jgi:hypothetical protein
MEKSFPSREYNSGTPAWSLLPYTFN